MRLIIAPDNPQHARDALDYLNAGAGMLLAGFPANRVTDDVDEAAAMGALAATMSMPQPKPISRPLKASEAFELAFVGSVK